MKRIGWIIILAGAGMAAALWIGFQLGNQSVSDAPKAQPDAKVPAQTGADPIENKDDPKQKVDLKDSKPPQIADGSEIIEGTIDDIGMIGSGFTVVRLVVGNDEFHLSMEDAKKYGLVLDFFGTQSVSGEGDYVRIRKKKSDVSSFPILLSLERIPDPKMANLTALLAAATKGDVKQIKEILTAHPEEISKKDTDGMTALHIASMNGQAEAVRLLLDMGAPVNAITNSDITPLYFASTPEVAESLLAKGADIKAQARFYGTSLHRAARNGKIGVVEVLLKHGAEIDNKGGSGGKTPLLEAIIPLEGSCLEMVSLLVRNGARVDLADDSGWTPLLKLAQLYDNPDAPDVASLLIQKGANVNARVSGDIFVGMIEFAGQQVPAQMSISEATPMHLAARKGNKKLIELFLANGAKADVKDGKGQTPLDWAEANKQTETAQYLRDLAAKP